MSLLLNFMEFNNNFNRFNDPNQINSINNNQSQRNNTNSTENRLNNNDYQNNNHFNQNSYSTVIPPLKTNLSFQNDNTGIYRSLSSSLSPSNQNEASNQSYNQNKSFPNSINNSGLNNNINNSNDLYSSNSNSYDAGNYNTSKSTQNYSKEIKSSKISALAPTFIPSSELQTASYASQGYISQNNQSYQGSTTKSPINDYLSLNVMQQQLGNIQQQSTGPKINPVSGYVYQIQFKRRVRYYVPCSAFSDEIKIGDHVKVEADRGEDMGLVKGILTVNTFYQTKQESLRLSPIKEEETAWEVKQILKLATPYERSLLAIKLNDETDVLMKARDLCEKVYKLPIIVVDAEYQFDRHKLTIMYDCNRRVDFREFVRDLFAIYKTRIWMQQVDSKESLMMPIKNISPASISVTPSPSGNISKPSFFNTIPRMNVDKQISNTHVSPAQMIYQTSNNNKPNIYQQQMNSNVNNYNTSNNMSMNPYEQMNQNDVRYTKPNNNNYNNQWM